MASSTSVTHPLPVDDPIAGKAARMAPADGPQDATRDQPLRDPQPSPLPLRRRPLRPGPAGDCCRSGSSFLSPASARPSRSAGRSRLRRARCRCRAARARRSGPLLRGGALPPTRRAGDARAGRRRSLAWLWLQAAGRRWWRLAAGLLLLSASGLADARARLVHEGDYAFDHLLLAEVHRQLGNLDEAVLEVKLAAETALGKTDAPLRLATSARGARKRQGGRGDRAEDAGRRSRGPAGTRDSRPAHLALRRSSKGREVPRTDFEIGTVLLVEEEDLEGSRGRSRTGRRSMTRCTTEPW